MGGGNICLGSATQWLKCTPSLDHLKKDSILHFLSPPKECGHLHHDPSAEFPHHTPLISSDMVDEDGARALVISESSHSPGGCCDLSKNITWIMHVLPPYIWGKQTQGGNVFSSVFAVFYVSNLTSYLFKICSNAYNVPDQSTLTPTSLFYHYLLWMWVASKVGQVSKARTYNRPWWLSGWFLRVVIPILKKIRERTDSDLKIMVLNFLKKIK